MTKIEQQGTADNSDHNNDNSGEFVVVRVQDVDKETIPEVASKRHRTALLAGICGIVVLAAVVTTVAVLVGKSFNNDSQADPSENFDFTDVNAEDSSNIRGSPAPVPAATPLGSTLSPMESLTRFPTGAPTNGTDVPSATPSDSPSSSPTVRPTTTLPTIATPSPTMAPNTRAPVTPVNETSPTLLTFCIIADVPYDDTEQAQIPLQIRDQMEGCEFLVHLGDILAGDIPCNESYYINIKEILLQSEIPAFIVPGDNEWNDCGNAVMIDAAIDRWKTHLSDFDTNWNHTLGVVRHLDYPESFYLVRKRSLIFGLNIVGGRVQDVNEWTTRLTDLSNWVKSIVEMNVPEYADGVVIMAHARPTEDHVKFFNPIRRFFRDDLDNQVPVMYVHGDGHKYIYTRNFMNQSNFASLQLEGGVRNPVLKFLADPYLLGPEVTSAFQHDRQLELM